MAQTNKQKEEKAINWLKERGVINFVSRLLEGGLSENWLDYVPFLSEQEDKKGRKIRDFSFEEKKILRSLSTGNSASEEKLLLGLFWFSLMNDLDHPGRQHGFFLKEEGLFEAH